MSVIVDAGNVPLGELLRLDRRVAIVTGAGSGMGEATALRFAEAGATVVAADINIAAAEAVAQQCRDRYGDGVFPAKVDITDSDQVARLATETSERHGRLDIWVNTAGLVSSSPVIDMTDEAWRRIVSVDLDGSFFCAREAARAMIAGGRGGVIVLVTSGSAHRGRPGRSHYVAAKHGSNGLTKSLAREFGPHGIRVLSVAPGMIDTPMLRAGLKVASQDEQSLSRQVHDASRQGMVLGRIGVSDDIARAVLFAVSDAAAFMTGSTLHVDGGAMTL